MNIEKPNNSNINESETKQEELSEEVLADILQKSEELEYKTIEDLPEEYQKYFVARNKGTAYEGFIKKDVSEHDLEISRKVEIANLASGKKYDEEKRINMMDIIQDEALNDEEGWRGKELDKLMTLIGSSDFGVSVDLYKNTTDDLKNNLEVILKILNKNPGGDTKENLKAKREFLESEVPDEISKDVLDIMEKY